MEIHDYNVPTTAAAVASLLQTDAILRAVGLIACSPFIFAAGIQVS